MKDAHICYTGVGLFVMVSQVFGDTFEDDNVSRTFFMCHKIFGKMKT